MVWIPLNNLIKIELYYLRFFYLSHLVQKWTDQRQIFENRGSSFYVFCVETETVGKTYTSCRNDFILFEIDKVWDSKISLPSD